MKPITTWTLRQRKWSVVWWSIAVFGLIFINMVFYPSFRNQAAELQKSLESLPDTAVQLFGGSTDFFSPVGFLNSQVFFLMLPLLLGVMAIGLGSGLIAREEQDRTIESLLARPISRTNLLVAKTAAGSIQLIIVGMVGLVTTIATAFIVNIGVSGVRIAEACGACLLLCLGFGAVSFAVTALGKGRSVAMGAGAFVALGGYLISSLSNTVHWLRLPSKLFAFHYYDPEAILRGAYHWANVLFMIAVILLCAVVSWYGFNHRDIL